MKNLCWLFFVTVCLFCGLVCRAAESDVPLAPADAARTMLVPDGFTVTLFAGEPDVKQPISFCIDDRGRLWVAEAYSYPRHGNIARDRILIFTDMDGDGRFDERTVFYDQLNYVTGIEFGFGGVWVMSPPYFYFIPDRNKDDKPDGKPVVLLDGFGNHANSHNLANAFAWGPDGWLYGTHGRTNWSLIGKPGTPDDKRVRFDGGVYRYHPVRDVWEPFADGTTNPWGIDFDDFGEGFVCNCVTPHLFHVVQGAHYEPWRNRKSSQFAYGRIPTIADHLHFIGTSNVRDGLGTVEEDVAGGGHAHCGTMVYLGDNWPDRYRNTVFMHNLHGRRINNDLLQRAGSGYTASHGQDVVRSQDPWFMGVTLLYGPDGAVFSSDWSDTGECHSLKNTRRHTGRIFKIAFGKPDPVKNDLATLKDQDLVQLQRHQNDWYVRHARRLLQERWTAGHDMSSVRDELQKMFHSQSDVPRKLRALWALHVVGGLENEFLIRRLADDSEYVRAWAVRLLCEDRDPPPAALHRFKLLAAEGDSSLVRLHLASSLQRISADRRWGIAAALLARSEDAHDANLPLMNWYAIEPLIAHHMQRFVELASVAKIPLIPRYIARRIASESHPEQGLAVLVGLLGRSGDDLLRLELLLGMEDGLEGRRTVTVPVGWSTTYTKLQQSHKEAVRESATRLALVFDDVSALRRLRSQVSDQDVSDEHRMQAVQALVLKKDQELPAILLRLVVDPVMRGIALRSLAEFDHPQTVSTILKHYASYDLSERQDALNTLASRMDWATKLLNEIELERIPRTDLTAFTVRQLQHLGNESLVAKLRKIWGEVRTTPADKNEWIVKYRQQLTADMLKQANLSAGRQIFQRTCANCHQLFDAGKKIGPDITGSQRNNLDYLLENLIDPSGIVAKDYQVHLVVTASGRIVTGLVIAESERAVTIQTVNEKLIIPAEEIEERSMLPVSMMPDGLLQKLSIEQVRDLVGYLASSKQVPLAAGN